MQPLHRFIEITSHRQRQHRDCRVDGASDFDVITSRCAAKHPGRDLVLVPGVADADAQAMELSVPEQLHGVAQSILTTMSTIELQSRDSRSKVEIIVREQLFLRFELPVTQRGGHLLATGIH